MSDDYYYSGLYAEEQAEAEARLAAEGESESNSPIKYYKRGGVIYAVHGTSSINFVERLLAEIADLTAKQPPSEGEEIMVNTAHDVYTLPLQPSGLSSGPRFVVHVTARPAASAEPVAWVAADTLHSPHPGCVSSLAYVSQVDKDRGREYVPLYAAPVPNQQTEQQRRDAERYRWLRVRWGRIADTYDGDSNRLVEIREADDRFEGWDVSPESLDAAIDAAIAHEQGD